MLVRPELWLPLAFSVSGLMIVAAFVLVCIGVRQSRRVQRPSPVRTDSPRRPKRSETLQLFSGATVAALEQATLPNPARKRQMRMYS